MSGSPYLNIMEGAVVSSLEDLAFKISYKEILGNLLLCSEHRPQGKHQVPWLAFSSYLSTSRSLTSPNMLKLIRGRLNQHLAGTMSDTIRRKYVDWFFNDVENSIEAANYRKHLTSDDDKEDKSSDDKDHSSDDEDNSSADEEKEDDDEEKESIAIDVWAFMECVLDNSFQQLKTHIAFPGTEPDSKLLLAISKHSPLLKKLELDFKWMKSDGRDIMDKLKPSILSLDSLKHLAHLELHSLRSIIGASVLSLIGKACPSLSRLGVGGYRFKKRDVLAIVLGELVEEMVPISQHQEPEWLQDDSLKLLVVPPARRTPLCSTLTELSFIWEKPDDADYDEELFSPAIAAFALRHFPRLKKMNAPVPTSMAIKIINDVVQFKLQMEFQKKCEEVAQRLIGTSATDNLAFQRILHTGTCNLTKLDFVDVLNKDMLLAVGSLCPSLKEVDFYQRLAHNSSNAHIFIPEELKSVLSKWPAKLEIVSLFRVESQYVESILDVFGPGLKSLTIESCTLINLQKLVCCHQLKDLSIMGSNSTLLAKQNEDEHLLFNIDTFLPALTCFQSDICLGEWSCLFERKSSLVYLFLSCCHIGMTVCHREKRSNEPSPKCFKRSVTDLEWSEIPQLWPLLQTLQIGICDGLNMSTASDLFPKFRMLKKLMLPVKLLSNERDLSRRAVVNQFSSRKPPIELVFKDFHVDYKCSFLDG